MILQLVYEVILESHAVPVVQVFVLVSSFFCAEVHIESMILFSEEKCLLSSVILAGCLNQNLHGVFFQIDQVERFSSGHNNERERVDVEIGQGNKPRFVVVTLLLLLDIINHLPVDYNEKVCWGNMRNHSVMGIFEQ